jgi:hypothetical protein
MPDESPQQFTDPSAPHHREHHLRTRPSISTRGPNAEWLVLGAICFTAIGALIAVQFRNN